MANPPSVATSQDDDNNIIDDEDELNVEFHQLELQCKEEKQQKQQQQRQQLLPKVKEVDSEDNIEQLLPAVIIEQPSDVVPKIILCQSEQQQQGDSRAKALPA
jgi:hypothetical protein